MEAAFNDFAWRSFCSSLFDKYDKSHTGALDRDEMFGVFCDVTGSGEEARGSEAALRFVAAMDQDNDKAISRAEFRRCCRDIVRQTHPGEAAARPCTASEAFAVAMARSTHPLLQTDGARAKLEGVSAAAPALMRRSTSHKARSVLVEVDDMRLTLLEVNVEAQSMVLALGVDAVEVEIAFPSRYAIGVPRQVTMRVRSESVPDGGATEMLDVLRALSADVAAHTDVNAKKHMAFILGTLAQRFQVLQRSEAVGRFLKETLRRPIRELCGLSPMLPLGASAELMERAERLRGILADEAQRLLTEPQEGFEVVPSERDPFVWDVRLHSFDRAGVTGTSLHQWAMRGASDRREEMWMRVEFPLDYPIEAPRFIFAQPLLESGTGYVDNGVVALSELRPDVWRARAGTVGALLLKFRLKSARGPCAAKVAVALCGEYDKVGYDATWRLLRSGAPEAQYGAARLEPGGTDEYGRRQRRSSLTDRNLAMRLVSMSEALAFAEHCGAGMERELRKNRCVSMCALARSLSHAHSCAAYPSPLATARHRPSIPATTHTKVLQQDLLSRCERARATAALR